MARVRDARGSISRLLYVTGNRGARGTTATTRVQLSSCSPQATWGMCHISPPCTMCTDEKKRTHGNSIVGDRRRGA
eukprot:3738772-Prymnesium_polylepis.1